MSRYIHASGTNLADMYAQFEKTVTNEPLQTSCGKLNISCSVGFAVFNRDTTNLYDLIDYADWAMYCAKKNGKHGWRSFEPLAFAQRHDQA